MSLPSPFIGSDDKKLSQYVVLYMPSAVLNPDGKPEGSRCGRCMMYLPDRKACTIIHKDKTKDTSVSGEHGVCGLFVGGKPTNSSDAHKPMPTVPRSVAGYIEGKDVPTRCGNCKNFVSPHDCTKVESPVEAFGCCNQWQEKAT